jgi:hypothetical protein
VDDVASDLISQINQLCPVGSCVSHPDIQCYHDRPTGLHFNVGDKNDGPSRKLSWAVYCVSSYFGYSSLF